MPIIPTPSVFSGLEGKSEVPTGALVPTASFSRANLLSKNPMIGFVDEATIHKGKPKMLNGTTDVSTKRRVIACRNDLRVKVGHPAKDKLTMKPPTGIGRKTKSIFPRDPNNLAVYVPASSDDGARNSKLGVPK
eukprot:5151391-Prymnesium_polylepis.7